MSTTLARTTMSVTIDVDYGRRLGSFADGKIAYLSPHVCDANFPKPVELSGVYSTVMHLVSFPPDVYINTYKIREVLLNKKYMMPNVWELLQFASSDEVDLTQVLTHMPIFAFTRPVLRADRNSYIPLLSKIPVSWVDRMLQPWHPFQKKVELVVSTGKLTNFYYLAIRFRQKVK